ncbi:MAG: hypothetical protein GY861_26190 [bacterium]|nr:hypothetical protein [bacterium]
MNVLRAAIYQLNNEDVMLIEEFENKKFRLTYDDEWLNKNKHGVMGVHNYSEPFIIDSVPHCCMNAVCEGERYEEACQKRGLDPDDQFGFWLDCITNMGDDTFLDGSGGRRIK